MAGTFLKLIRRPRGLCDVGLQLQLCCLCGSLEQLQAVGFRLRVEDEAAEGEARFVEERHVQQLGLLSGGLVVVSVGSRPVAL